MIYPQHNSLALSSHNILLNLITTFFNAEVSIPFTFPSNFSGFGKTTFYDSYNFEISYSMRKAFLELAVGRASL